MMEQSKSNDENIKVDKNIDKLSLNLKSPLLYNILLIEQKINEVIDKINEKEVYSDERTKY